MPRKLRWGLLSTARINRALLTPLSVSERNELAAVASRSTEKAETYARQHHIPQAYGSYEALINDPEIDVIYNSLPNHLHADWTVQAALAGKHVLVEKPIGLTAQEVAAMDDAARSAGVVVAEAFMYRHVPQTIQVLEMVASGELGDITMINGRFNATITTPDDYRWTPEYGGGAMWDVGCYPVSYARAVTGMPPMAVFAWEKKAPSGVDETIVCQFQYANGIFGHIYCSMNMPHNTWFEIIGTKGSIHMANPFQTGDHPQATLRIGRKEHHLNFPFQDSYLAEVEDMADAILEGKPTRMSLEESRQNTATITAVLQSAQESGVMIRPEDHL